VRDELTGVATAGPFRLGDRWITPDANEIDGVRIDAKSMDVLLALAEVAPAVISGAALLDRVWPNVVVVDNVVYQAIAQLRKALGDDAHAPRFIENIPRRGYRLIAEIEHEAREARAPDRLGARTVAGEATQNPAVHLDDKQASYHDQVQTLAKGCCDDLAAVNGSEPQVITDAPPASEPVERKTRTWYETDAAAFAAAIFVVAAVGFTNRSDIGVWLALYVTPIVSRPIDQKIGFATTSDGVRIAYATSGSGPPLVLVVGWFSHLKDGLGSPSYDSAGYIRWWSRDHLVVRYDGRGFGLSDRNVDDFSLDARVRDLEAVVDALGLQRFALDGYSAGGPTALTYIDRHPERVSRLILLATFINSSFVDAKWTERYAAADRMWEFARTDWEKPAARAAVVEWMHPNASEIERRVLMTLYLNSGDGTAFANFASVKVDATNAARGVHVPTLVVAGTADTELPVEATSQVAKAIRGARFELLDGADHFETIGNDPRVLELVSSFLAEDVRVE
jgi:pimeloyl-ACP methyl ester carboxylesterase/DNA-binding winged helix-turn-helix (wHTH) protein